MYFIKLIVFIGGKALPMLTGYDYVQGQVMARQVMARQKR